MNQQKLNNQEIHILIGNEPILSLVCNILSSEDILFSTIKSQALHKFIQKCIKNNHRITLLLDLLCLIDNIHILEPYCDWLDTNAIIICILPIGQKIINTKTALKIKLIELPLKKESFIKIL